MTTEIPCNLHIKWKKNPSDDPMMAVYEILIRSRKKKKKKNVFWGKSQIFLMIFNHTFTSSKIAEKTIIGLCKWSDHTLCANLVEFERLVSKL